MAGFELIFEVPAMTDDLEDRIADRLDAVIAVHMGVVTVTVEVDAPDAVSAARATVNSLVALGVRPLRLIDDLVTRSQIAERLGVTRQAVSLWVSGAREAVAGFPAPYVTTSGGLWRWGEIVEAYAASGRVLDDGVRYPSRRDAQIIGGIVASHAPATGDVWASGNAREVSFTSVASGATFMQAAPNAARVDFGLAA